MTVVLVVDEPFAILTVCTANICRSPAAAHLLRSGLESFTESVVVTSAGTGALPGSPACDLSSALVGKFVASVYAGDPAAGPRGPEAEGATVLTPELVGRAGLILALDRGHRGAVSALDPAARRRTFTLRQAASLSVGVRAFLERRELPEGAPPLPPGADSRARLRWFVDELDAARGSGPAGPGDGLWGPDDVPDPHVLGYQMHGAAIQLIEDAATSLLSAMCAALQLDAEATT